MRSVILFPHFYLSNELFLRHQYLYAQSVLRALPSDRPPQDSKPVKRLLTDLKEQGVVDPLVPEERSGWVSERFSATMRRAFVRENDLYTEQLGKYGKERSSTKTYHLCRVKIWPEIVALLIEMDLASLDSISGGSKIDFERLDEIRRLLSTGGEIPAEWCLSTRQTVITFLTCLTLEYQQQNNLPRATDDPLYDRLAALIECLPAGDGTDQTIRRAVLEVPYWLPNSLPDLPMDEMKKLREESAPFAEQWYGLLGDGAEAVTKADSEIGRQEAVRQLNASLKELFNPFRMVWERKGMRTETRFAQYRWYLPFDPTLRMNKTDPPYTAGSAGLNIFPLPVALPETERIATYPGCLVWTRPEASLGQSAGLGGFFKKWFG